jgi:hypothetical protein
MDNATTLTPAQQAAAIIAQHPDWCYRSFVNYHWQLFWDHPEASDVLEKARSHCGYDCDGGCPVSGRHENDGRRDLSLTPVA